MTEPAKPITRLAVPIDRTGRRGRNRLGDAALRLAVWTFPVVLLVSVLVSLMGTVLPAATALLIGVLAFVVFPLALATSVALAIPALIPAANLHLRRREAIAALVIAILLLCPWSIAAFLGPFWGTRSWR